MTSHNIEIMNLIIRESRLYFSHVRKLLCLFKNTLMVRGKHNKTTIVSIKFCLDLVSINLSPRIDKLSSKKLALACTHKAQ